MQRHGCTALHVAIHCSMQTHSGINTALVYQLFLATRAMHRTAVLSCSALQIAATRIGSSAHTCWQQHSCLQNPPTCAGYVLAAPITDSFLAATLMHYSSGIHCSTLQMVLITRIGSSTHTSTQPSSGCSALQVCRQLAFTAAHTATAASSQCCVKHTITMYVAPYPL